MSLSTSNLRIIGIITAATTTTIITNTTFTDFIRF